MVAALATARFLFFNEREVRSSKQTINELIVKGDRHAREFCGGDHLGCNIDSHRHIG
jgi:hypothetical protein